MAKKRTPAVSYLRVSGQGQVDGDGFPRQRKAVEDYATSAGLGLIDEFRDEGVSGTLGIADRPGLSELLERVLGNGVRVVLVEKADRLARDLIEGELILRELREAGVQVIAAESGTDLSAGDDSDPTATLIRQVLGAVAQFEKSVIVARLRAARARKRRTEGRCEGRKPFGHYPGEPETLDRMRQLRRKPRGGDRLSYDRVAATLKKEGRPSRTGRAWTGPVVRRILLAQ